MHAQLDRLEWLVSSLLKLARLDAGAIVFRPAMHEARAVLEKACEPLSISAELREQTLLIDVPEGLRVKCDLNWTAEALLNVIKKLCGAHARGGTVTVSARQNPLYALFMVADTGEGIAKEDQPHLFERFYRGKNARRTASGSALPWRAPFCGRRAVRSAFGAARGRAAYFR